MIKLYAPSIFWDNFSTKSIPASLLSWLWCKKYVETVHFASKNFRHTQILKIALTALKLFSQTYSPIIHANLKKKNMGCRGLKVSQSYSTSDKGSKFENPVVAAQDLALYFLRKRHVHKWIAGPYVSLFISHLSKNPLCPALFLWKIILFPLLSSAIKCE